MSLICISFLHSDEGMDSEALRTFVAIHRSKGFSSAGAALGRSQPAISRRIAQLEGEIGVPLFERVAGGVVLSQAGRALLPHAERALAAMRDGAAAVGELQSGKAGPVSLAIVGTLAGAGLTAALKRFSSRYPGAALSLQTANSADVSALVRRGDADIGVRYFDDPAPDLACHFVGNEKLVVVCGRKHPRAGKRVARLADLKAEHWFAFPVVPGKREASAQIIHVQFLLRGVDALKWTPVDSLTAQKRLVEAGLGLALLPESSIQEERVTRTLAIVAVRDLDAANPVFAVVRKDGYLGASSRALLELLRSNPFYGST
jgi:DNA-binding transcriptional LysR family regulator